METESRVQRHCRIPVFVQPRLICLNPSAAGFVSVVDATPENATSVRGSKDALRFQAVCSLVHRLSAGFSFCLSTAKRRGSDPRGQPCRVAEAGGLLQPGSPA